MEPQMPGVQTKDREAGCSASAAAREGGLRREQGDIYTGNGALSVHRVPRLRLSGDKDNAAAAIHLRELPGRSEQAVIERSPGLLEVDRRHASDDPGHGGCVDIWMPSTSECSAALVSGLAWLSHVGQIFEPWGWRLAAPAIEPPSSCAVKLERPVRGPDLVVRGGFANRADSQLRPAKRRPKLPMGF
nr:hypothetical protein Iba_chr13aCG4330 [Ipomoea batatas]